MRLHQTSSSSDHGVHPGSVTWTGRQANSQRSTAQALIRLNVRISSLCQASTCVHSLSASCATGSPWV